MLAPTLTSTLDVHKSQRKEREVYASAKFPCSRLTLFRRRLECQRHAELCHTAFGKCPQVSIRARGTREYAAELLEGSYFQRQRLSVKPSDRLKAFKAARA